MNLLNIYGEMKLICPRCKNPNYMVSLANVSDAFQYKCTNCNSYFTFDGSTLRTSPIKKDLVEVVRCKDCKFRFDLHCPLDVDHKQAPDWFCADGKRKEADPDA